MQSRAHALLIPGFLVLLTALVRADVSRVEVEALFTDAAFLKIDGERKMLKAGQSHKGVVLVSAHSRTATLEIDGVVVELGTTRRIGTRYERAESQVVSIPRDAMLQYQTTARINGRAVQVLVDTGANVVALNSRQADALGIDYSAGQLGRVETASGAVNAWIVNLRSVDVGGIRVENVQASVLEGSFPSTVLLGMTFLRHVKMEEVDGVLSLSRAWQ
ncbi:MAG: TIGR02281 family clan AA aspartic protease [Pseudomonadota bacterium]